MCNIIYQCNKVVSKDMNTITYFYVLIRNKQFSTNKCEWENVIIWKFIYCFASFSFLWNICIYEFLKEGFHFSNWSETYAVDGPWRKNNVYKFKPTELLLLPRHKSRLPKVKRTATIGYPISKYPLIYIKQKKTFCGVHSKIGGLIIYKRAPPSQLIHRKNFSDFPV